MSEINFKEDKQDLVDKTDIQTLASYCKDLQTYENEIIKLEELIKHKRDQADKISSEIIPNLLAEQGLSSLKLADGSSITVKKTYRCTVRKDEIKSAHKWLRENGLGDIIKNEVAVRFSVEAGLDMPSQFFSTFVKDQTKIDRK